MASFMNGLYKVPYRNSLDLFQKQISVYNSGPFKLTEASWANNKHVKLHHHANLIAQNTKYKPFLKEIFLFLNSLILPRSLDKIIFYLSMNYIFELEV
jgi:hypothetical protein